MFGKLFRTKSLEQLSASVDAGSHGGGGGLHRTLGRWDLMLLGIGAIIGAGILSALGTGLAGGLDSNFGVERPAAGPALIVSFLLTAIACGFTAFCYAEMASMIPVSGSAYTYAYATLGELIAWVIGWDLLLEYAVSNVAVAISWGSYADNLLRGMGVEIPRWLTSDTRSMLMLSEEFGKAHSGAGFGAKLEFLAQAKSGLLAGADVFKNWDILKTAPLVSGIPIGVNLLAMVVTVFVTWLCVLGIKESVRLNSVMVALKVLLLVAVIVVGAKFVKPENYHPFAPNGLSGIQAGAAIIFFAYIGFDAVSTTAEETENPSRDLPWGIIGSLIVCTILYVGVAAVVSGMLPYHAYANISDPIAHAFKSVGMNGVAGVVSVAAVIAITGTLLVYQLAQPRIFMAMSRDGLLPPWFSKISVKRKTPVNSTLLTGAIVMIPAGLMNIDEVVELTNIGTLFAFVLVCLGVIILRVRRPAVQRKFRTPLVWLVAPMGIVSCGWLAWGLPRATWERFLIWLALGMVTYFFYGSRHSKLRAPGGT